MFASIKSRSFENGSFGVKKLDHQAKSKGNPVSTLEVTFFKKSSRILLKIFVLMILGQIRNWVTWGQKPGHQAKSKENLVNTQEVTVMK